MGYISDGSRVSYRPQVSPDGKTALSEAHRFYRRDLWQTQQDYVEIWSEKDAISSVVLPVTDEFGVPLLITRGYASETFLHNSAEVIMAQNKDTTIYQLGDHDPSGVDSWRATTERLAEFTADHYYEVYFHRLAVTERQIDEYSLPTRPTKSSDTRAGDFNGGSVEVDAIPSPVLRDIVREAIEDMINPDTWEIEQRIEAEERGSIFDLIEDFVSR